MRHGSICPVNEQLPSCTSSYKPHTSLFLETAQNPTNVATLLYLWSPGKLTI